MTGQEFVLPVWVDLAAVGVFALSGAGAGIRRGYDLIGIVALALVTGLGGAMLRELMLHGGPPGFLVDWRYLVAVGVGAIAVIPFQKLIERHASPMLTIDALGLAAYTVVGAQKAMTAGVAVPGVILIGVMNGVGGSILRDVITREEPLLFKPGQYYAAAGFLGAAVFVALEAIGSTAGTAALGGIGMTFFVRMAAVRFNWRTVRVG